MNIKLLFAIFTFLTTLGFSALTVAKDTATLIELSDVLIVDHRLVDLLQLQKLPSNNITNQLDKLQLTYVQLNAAEQYLVLLLNAISFEKENNHQQVIELVTKAHLLNNKIPVKQLNTPLFSQSHLILSKSYVELQQFDKAYLAKIDYYDSLQNFTWDEHDKKVELLNEKYETTQKQQRNELLVSESKLKAIKLKELERNNNSQQKKTLLIIIITIVFIFLLIRQLAIKKQLVKLAKIDGLTQLPNRRFLFEQGQQLVNDANKANTTISVMVADVDNFKMINDQYGHDVGDKVLKKLATIGGDVMRNRDFFARLGGEEFVALLPDATLEEIKAIAQRLREKLSVCDFTSLGINEPLSVSIGISTLNEEITNFETLLHTADSAMYHAKAHGRDQVVLYTKAMNINPLNRIKRSVD